MGKKEETAEQILEDVASAFYKLVLTDTAHKYIEVDREALQEVVRAWQIYERHDHEYNLDENDVPALACRICP